METATLEETPVEQNRPAKVYSAGTIIIKVPLERIRAMIPLASTDAGREVLNALHFDVQKDQTLIVASDRRRLGVSRITQENLQCGSFSVTVFSLCALLKARKVGKDEQAFITYHGNGKTTLKRDVFSTEDVEPGKFPNWREVLPCHSQRAVNGPSSVDPAFLRSLCDAAGETVTIYCHGESKQHLPVEIISKSFYGLLMPFRVEAMPKGEWLE